MEWSERMNSAIDYIENNLDDEIHINEAAKIACCSSYHFQRMFFAIIGITPAEYARRRRLTLAATELATGDAKVIDVALKYGYDSPNSFTRAFRNMHGINPGAARAPGVKLTAFPRISIHIEIKGENDMDYRIVEKPAFDIIGKSKKFNMSTGEFFKEAPKFWGKFTASKEYQKLWDLNNGKWGSISEAPLMSVYFPDEKGTKDSVIDILGIEKHDKMDTDGFEIFHIPATTWAEFNCTTQTSKATNKRIYSEWFTSTGYERDSKPDIAAYYPIAFRSQMNVRWWIPILKKK